MVVCVDVCTSDDGSLMMVVVDGCLVVIFFGHDAIFCVYIR